MTLTDGDKEMISAYIDGELAIPECHWIEERLNTSNQHHEYYKDLLYQKAVVQEIFRMSKV